MRVAHWGNRHSRDRQVARRGAAVVETAVCLPFLFLLLFGVWEVGRLVQVSAVVSNAAREGARLASTGLYSSSGLVSGGTGQTFEVQRAVVNYLHNSNLPISSTGVTVTVRNESTNMSASAQATANSSSGMNTVIALSASGSAPANDPTMDTAVSQFQNIRVDVTYPFEFARWSPNNFFFFLGANRNIVATARWKNLRDKPINLNSTIPNQPY